MSLGIEISDVTAVLLGNQWTEVERGTFGVDAYEYMEGEVLLHGGGQSGVCAAGFALTTPDGIRLAGPLTSVKAVRVASGPGR